MFDFFKKKEKKEKSDELSDEELFELCDELTTEEVPPFIKNPSNLPKWEPKWTCSANPEDWIHTGPRGGRYRVNKKGRKSYDVR
tara:strand:- start:564 stop:815 length:252 start_codon:yes stop_codon:yes gene_type:complete